MAESGWKVDDSAALYQVKGWGSSFFDINDKGHMVAIPDGKNPVDLKKLYDELTARDLYAPLLLRFSDILRERMGQIHSRFMIAREEAEYQGQYFGVYPIKVNQQRQVVEEIVERSE
ncbi:MAG: arginine decarboxylase, partial [Mariprofundaceae bacterium]|nr:arginine decarboxylase [Mariprofundaceae bacterium]